MRRLIVLSAAFIFVFVIMVIPPDKSSIIPTKTETPKPVTVKATKETNVSFTGIVNETTDTTIVVERTVKDQTEALEFVLDKAVEKIKAGDKVKISYVKKEGKYIAKQVTLVTPKRISKKVTSAREVKQDLH